MQCSRTTAPGGLTYPQSSVSIGQITLASKMPMKPLYAGLITAAAIVGAILICVGCRRCQCAIIKVQFTRRRCDISIFNAIDATFPRAGRCYRTRDYDDGKARRYIPGITDEENALVDEQYYHDRTSGQEGKEF